MVSPGWRHQILAQSCLYVPHDMVRYTFPVSDVSGAIIWGFYAICPTIGVLKLEWLVHANDPINPSKQHEISISEVLPCFLRSFERFFDQPGTDGFTILSSGIFWWLINIHPGYLIFWQENICTIEPYWPSRFARRFGYDRLYLDNPNLGLHFSDNLYERARVWYFNVAGGMEAKFNLPQKVPNSYASLEFCAWYIIADSVPSYNINSTCIKWIKAMFQVKKGSKTTHLKGMDEFLQAELEVDLTGTG